MEMQELRRICDKKIEYFSLSKDKKNEEIMRRIKVILMQDNAFKRMDVSVAMNIFHDLGFNKEDAKKIYARLLQK